MAKTRVVILFGGVSSEHSISCATASGVLSAIDREKYEVIPVGITQTGIYVPAEDSVSKWALTEGELPVVEFEGKKVIDRKSTRLNSSHIPLSRMPSSA